MDSIRGGPIVYGVLGALLLAFGCMAAGYTVLVRQAMHSAERRRLLWLIVRSVHDPELDPLGKNLIYLGAGIGMLVFSVGVLGVFWVLRQ